MTDAHQIQSRFWQRPAFALVLLPLLAILLNAPFLSAGFFADDFFFLNALRNDAADFSRWQGMWAMKDYSAFEAVWWMDHDWHGQFFRPLPSLVLEGSIRLFGENPFPLHLLTLLLHASVCACLYWLVRQLTGRHGLAFLAALFYVVCEDHALTVGWIAAITDVLCVQFILLGLISHIRWLRSRKPTSLVISLAMIVIAMGCKETAVAAPVAIMLLTFLMPRGPEGLQPIANIKGNVTAGLGDLSSWVPHAALLVIYLGIYKGFGLGPGSNLIYIDPLADPVALLAQATYRLPVMWLGTFTSWPPFLVMIWESTKLPMAAAGLIVFVMWVVALCSFRRYPVAIWAFLLYHAALFPQLSTDANERSLYFPMVPAVILLALVVSSIRPLARRMLPDLPVRKRWTKFVGWFAIVTALVPGIIISAARPHVMNAAFGRPERELITAIPLTERHHPTDVVILNTSSLMLTLYTYDIINFHSDRQLKVWPLSSANGVFSLERIGDSSFVMRDDRHGWLGNWFARVLRTEDSLRPGRSYETPVFFATLEELTEDGRDALTVRFDFKQSLDDPDLLFLCWNGSSFEPLDIAALELGQSVELFDSSDLWAALQ